MQGNNHNKHRFPDRAIRVTMHEGEFDIDTVFVRRLLVEQFPYLAERSITEVRSTGTVNAIYRLGEDLCVRVPRLGKWAEGLERELIWLPKLAPYISLTIPLPWEKGTPTDWYPYPWAIYRWIDGSVYQDHLIQDERQAARDLANFIFELRGVNMAGAPRGGRDPLIELDSVTRAAISSSQDVIDAGAALAAWIRMLEITPWNEKPVWIHGDLLRPNLLVKDGRLRSVIDFGGVGIGDPAADVIPAWSVFNKAGRIAFRQALDVDDDTWCRGRAYALHQALLIIPYYPETNPEFVALAKRTVEEILADLD